jgi:hypothetical protein
MPSPKPPVARSIGFILSTALLNLFPVASAGASFVEKYEGTAKDLDGRLVYREVHEVTYDSAPPSGRVQVARTRYLNPDGSIRAELDSEFTGPSFLPSYTFKDHKLGVLEGVKLESDSEKLEVFHQQKRKKIAFKPDWVSGQGFHYFSRASLEKIAAGEKRLLEFLIPSRLENFSFRIRKGEAGTERRRPDQREIDVVLEVQNWLLRIFAPKITATYDMDSRRLLRYLGPSNIQTEKGDVQTVRIEYQYP